jgi:[acyl-carrier-protein] S-malonyltransferase
MAKQKKRALVICPGRGTYGASELGYLKARHADKTDLLQKFDDLRRRKEQMLITELDSAASFSVKEHTRGDNAAGLIYASAYCDFLSIDPEEYEVVAVASNSMGWYIALACAGVLSAEDGFALANTMGTLMQETSIGAQLVYSLVDEHWQEVPGRREALMRTMSEIAPDALYTSIELGGMIVLAGETEAIKKLNKALPRVQERFPFILLGHSAFHTPLQAPVSDAGRAELKSLGPSKPQVPLIDGRGHIWSPYSASPESLWDYTLGHQVVRPYDFTKSVQVAAREYAPDEVLILGPGSTLYGAVAQSLLAIGWQGLTTKQGLADRQKEAPLIRTLGS